MTVEIHRDPQLLKCLQKLSRAGGRAALAAERVDTILAQLASPSACRPVPKLTKFGERRIAGCKKFNLGGGYRLIYVQEDNHYVFLFAGTHDDCDRWLNNNKRLKATIPETPPSGPPPQAAATPAAADRQDTASGLDDDASFMPDIDEKMLRRIFRGLCGE